MKFIAVYMILMVSAFSDSYLTFSLSKVKERVQIKNPSGTIFEEKKLLEDLKKIEPTIVKIYYTKDISAAELIKFITKLNSVGIKEILVKDLLLSVKVKKVPLPKPIKE